jgi:hypothetical protein
MFSKKMGSIKMEAYTEDQKHQNFLDLLAAVSALESGRITEDWMEKQKRQIWRYRMWFYDFNEVSSHINDPEYRTAARISEECLSKLIDQIKEIGTFDTITYHKMIVNIKFLVEYCLESGELMELMKKFNLQ